MNFAAQLQQWAAQSPTAAAVQFKDKKLTYAELVARMEGFEADFGSVDGMRVVVLLPDSLETYLFYLFLFLGRASVVPLSVQLTGARIQTVIDRVKPHLVLTNELLHETHRESLSTTACLLVGADNAARPCGFDWQMPGGDKSIRDIPVSSEPGTEQVRVIIFTSGSTGIPKGVCLGESNLISAAGMMVDFLPVTPATRSMVTVPLYDYYGLIQIFGHIIGGGSFILGNNPAFAKQFHQTMTNESVTDLVLVPHTLRKVTDVPPQTPMEGMRRLKRITSSSDILTEELLKKTFQINPEVTVVNIYGLTEAGRACYKIIERDAIFSKSIGRASKGVDVVIEGDEANPGEIILKGPNVMLGYFRGLRSNDGLIEHTVCTEMPTGDLGYFDAAGEIVLLGRKDHMFNLMGTKIHPTEIEMAALKVPGIQEAQARLVQGPNEQPAIHLDVVFSNGKELIEELKEELRKTLPRMFVPATITPVSGLARTELGSKVIRKPLTA
jgi:long-chain acyl-CoA synthetase